MGSLIRPLGFPYGSLDGYLNKKFRFYRKPHKTWGFLNGYIVLWTDLSTTYHSVDKGRLIGYTRLIRS
nr:MAG TPA: hypothetical protein [Caudoviricetes sp.]